MSSQPAAPATAVGVATRNDEEQAAHAQVTTPLSVTPAQQPQQQPPLLILYGSQTGTAQESAERVARCARLQRLFSRVRCMSMDALDRRALPSTPLVLFVCSTTGQGEPPDNMKQLYRFLLRRDLPSDSLVALQFGVFGLGDSSYPLFNAIARRLHVRLQELGAHPLLERGLGDEQAPAGCDEALEPWMDELWRAIEVRFPRKDGQQAIAYADAPPPALKYRVEVVRREAALAQARADEQAAVEKAALASTLDASIAASGGALPVQLAPVLPPFASLSPADGEQQQHTNSATPLLLPLRLLRNDRLTPASHFQDVRLLQFEIPPSATQKRLGWPAAAPTAAGPAASATTPNPAASDAGCFSHHPGDVLLLQPRNVLTPEEVDWVNRVYSVDVDSDFVRITLATTTTDNDEDDDGSSPSAYPRHCRLRQLLEQYLDIHGTPRRYFFEQLSRFARGEPASIVEAEREKLTELADARNYAEYARYCLREKRTFTECFVDFPHSAPPTLAHLLQLVPALRPREFSIASALSSFPSSQPRVEILVALLDFKTPMGRARRGICSQWIGTLDPLAQGIVYALAGIKRGSSGSAGSFRPPLDPRVPVLMVGPGTGIAPFRAMAQHRAAQKRLLEQEAYEDEPNELRAGGERNSNDDNAAASAIPAAADADGDGDGSVVHHRGYVPYTILFGNRNRASDFFFRDEWTRLDEDEHVVRFFAAFSRDEPSEAEVRSAELAGVSYQRKRYVQHVLEQDQQLARSVARMLTRENGVVMVAGSAGQMTRDVRAAIVRVLQRYGGDGGEGAQQGPTWTESQALEYLKLMDRKRRYMVEAW